jgi:hypothetical protein
VNAVWKQPGVTSRFTRDEVDRIRETYRQWQAARIQRIRVCKELGLRSDLFCRIGQGVRGKKPRVA